MSVYELLKFVHIMAAVVWVGGSVAMQILSFRVMRSGDAARRAALTAEIELLGTRVFTPASGILLLFGIFLVINGNWEWGEPWIGGGLAIWLVSTVVGSTFLGPELGRVQKLAQAEGPESAPVRARVDRLLLVSRVDLALLVLAIFLMTTKPGTNF
ncbi:MAG: DUF2269 domain-containing protein [Actinomycetota bacterium]|nr:DUF2269 domain-containing protein [Actinomycetota bacterium]